MNYIQIVGKVVKQLTKKKFEDNIIIDAAYIEIPQINDDTEILRISLWDDAVNF